MENHGHRPKRMLIIEDDYELHTVLERAARDHCPDLEVDWTADLRSARSRLERGRYDVVLADYVLSRNERGTEIQAWCEARRIPVRLAIMSSTPLGELMEVVPDPGVKLLPKPFTTLEFAGFVESLLDRSIEADVQAEAS